VSNEQPIGPMLDGMGVTIDLEPGQQITEVVIIAKVVDFSSGNTAVGLYKSQGTDWVGQLGLMAAAQQIIDAGSVYCPDDDDDDC
jgi:hypothetical protein